MDSDFYIEIDFDKETEKPSRVFRTMSNLIDTFESLDNNLITSIHSKLETVLILEDIEAGSVRAWLSNRIKGVDDIALKSGEPKKIIGQYLLKAKYSIINFLDGKTRITDRKEIDQLSNELYEIAENTDMLFLPSYKKLSHTQLLNCIDEITKAIIPLSENDDVSYIVDKSKISFNKEFQYIPEKIEELITKEIETSEMTMYLKVKKPDYLGESMWEFKHGRSSINAKIVDVKWLNLFQQREFDIRPKDSIKAKVRIVVNYDYDHNPISTKHEIVEVLEIIRYKHDEQTGLFEE